MKEVPSGINLLQFFHNLKVSRLLMIHQKNRYQQIHFVLSAARLQQLPEDLGYEIAFAGRSNAGKSSVFNTLSGITNLAKTSKTPGRTRLINIFSLDDMRRLIDLPGYGYAKVSQEIKTRWQHTLSLYLQERQCLRGVILVMDIRHPMTPLDQSMIEWAIRRSLNLHILLTKADKLTKTAALRTKNMLQQHLAPFELFISIQLFSSLKKTGIPELQVVLDQWFEIPKAL